MKSRSHVQSVLLDTLYGYYNCTHQSLQLHVLLIKYTNSKYIVSLMTIILKNTNYNTYI